MHNLYASEMVSFKVYRYNGKPNITHIERNLSGIFCIQREREIITGI